MSHTNLTHRCWIHPLRFSNLRNLWLWSWRNIIEWTQGLVTLLIWVVKIQNIFLNFYGQSNNEFNNGMTTRPSNRPLIKRVWGAFLGSRKGTTQNLTPSDITSRHHVEAPVHFTFLAIRNISISDKH
jgi:hypothetical protein